MGTGANITCIRGQLLNSTYPIKPCSDNILMYGMQHIKDKYSAVIVTFVLGVIDDMTVYVFINGNKLPDS